MNKSDLLASISPAALAEVAQESRTPSTQANVHVEDIPPNIRNAAYEMAGEFFESKKRSPRFRRACRVALEKHGLPGTMTAETFAIIFWPDYVNIAIECLTECLSWPSFPLDEKDVIADELIEFNAKRDARAASVVRNKKIIESLN